MHKIQDILIKEAQKCKVSVAYTFFLFCLAAEFELLDSVCNTKIRAEDEASLHKSNEVHFFSSVDFQPSSKLDNKFLPKKKENFFKYE